MKKYISEFCNEFNFPENTAETMCSAWDKINASREAEEIFTKYIDDYESGGKINHPKMLEEVRHAAELSGVHTYTAELLIYICLTRHLRKMYSDSGYTEEMFAGVAEDLRCKLIECQKVKGITGSFVAFWFDRFFDMTRFALGRLQFETDKYTDADMEIGDVLIKSGSNAISVHIPSSGPLFHDAVLDSYKKAEKFYKDYFGGGPTIIKCGSWLLYPPMLDFLPKSSRIRDFMSDFKIVTQEKDPGFCNCWRLFDVDYTGDPSILPRDASTRRAYADWIASGGVPGYGFGILVIKDSEILTHI